MISKCGMAEMRGKCMYVGTPFVWMVCKEYGASKESFFIKHAGKKGRIASKHHCHRLACRENPISNTMEDEMLALF